jgi:hypothetical protein
MDPGNLALEFMLLSTAYPQDGIFLFMCQGSILCLVKQNQAFSFFVGSIGV